MNKQEALEAAHWQGAALDFEKLAQKSRQEQAAPAAEVHPQDCVDLFDHLIYRLQRRFPAEIEEATTEGQQAQQVASMRQIPAAYLSDHMPPFERVGLTFWLHQPEPGSPYLPSLTAIWSGQMTAEGQTVERNLDVQHIKRDEQKIKDAPVAAYKILKDIESSVIEYENLTNRRPAERSGD